MKKIVSFLVVVVLVLSLTPTAFAKKITSDKGVSAFSVIDWETTTLAPGVTQDIVYAKMDRNGNQTVFYMAKANPQDENVEIHANYKNNQWDEWGMQNTSEQMKAAQAKHSNPNDRENYIPNYNVVAGVNADFYNMTTGEPEGAFAMEGQIVKPARGSFFAILENGKAVIGYNASDWEKYNKQSPIKEAVGGGTALIQGGVIKNTNTGDQNARTAIGVTSDNQVVMLMVDGKQLPFSGGADMWDLATILYDAGCVEAINLDGGGSSTYAAKQEGEDEIKVVNRPCDGYERIVSTSLMIVSTVPDDKAFNHAVIEKDAGYITPGGIVNLTATGVTAAGNSAPIPEDVVWRVKEGCNGTITQDGVYTAPENIDTTDEEVTIELVNGGSIVGSTTIHVVIPNTFSFSLSKYALPYNESFELEFKATCDEGLHEVKLHRDDVELQIDNQELGTLNGWTFSSRETQGTGATTGTLTATFKYNSLSDTAGLTLGKGTEVLFNFEDAAQIEKFDAEGAGDFKWLNIKEEIKWADKSKGHVYKGDHSLALHVDFSDTITYGNACQAMLRYIGEKIDLTNALGIGAWVWMPDEEEAMSAWIRTPYKDSGGGVQRTDSDNYVVGNGLKYDEGHWVYLYNDLTSLDGLELYFDKSYALGTIHICIMSNGWDFENYKSINGDLWFYVDDITVDYSVIVPDRGLPVFGDVKAVLDSGRNISMGQGALTDCGESENVSFTAKVTDDTSLRNVTGINPDTVEAYVDGVRVGASYIGDSITTESVKLAEGVHTLKLGISDNTGNPSTVIRRFKISGNTNVPTVTVTAHNPELDKIPIGSVYYLDVTATDVSKVQSVSMDLDLNNVSTWELAHAEVNPKFSLSYTIDERENIATVTITRQEPYSLDDSPLLASLPVRTWVSSEDEVTSKEGVRKKWTAAEYWKGGSDGPILWAQDISVFVDRGEITFVAGYETDVRNTFSAEEVQVDTELFSSAALIQKEYPEKKSWHIHDANLEESSKPATCTENGYSGRMICKTCGSVVDDNGWGTVVEASKTGHVYELIEGVLKCKTCEKTFTGVFTDGRTYNDGKMQENGWTEDNRYFLDGKPLTGVQEAEGKYYDFGTDGICEGREVYTGFFEHDGNRYYALNGDLQTGWVIVKEEMFHTLEDGALHTTTMKDTRGCTTNGYKIYTCNVCPVEPGTDHPPQYQSEALWWEGHKWDENYHCTECGADGINIADCELRIQGKYFDYLGAGVNVEAAHLVIDNAAGGRWLYLNSDRRGVDGYSEFFNCADIGHAKVVVHGRGEYYGDIEGTYDIVPQSVKSVTATEIGQDGEHTSVKLDWEAPLGAEYYGVYKFDTAQDDWVKLGETNETTYTIDGLTIGESYRFRVASRAKRNGEVFACTTWAYAEGTVEHHWVEDTTQSVAAGCETTGRLVRDCSVCGAHEDKEVAATGHKVEEWTVTKSPTVYEEGQQEGECTVCGETVTKTLDRLPYVNPGSSVDTSPENKTETVTNPDGSTTTTTTKPDGTTTETTKQTDGTVTEKVTAKDGTVTETTEQTDGTVTEKITEKDGTSVETTTTPEGVVGTTGKDASGNVTNAEVTVPQGGSEGVVKAPVEVPSAGSTKDAPQINVHVQGEKSVKMEVPVTDFGPGTVAVLVHPDGTEEVVRDCVISENGVVLNVEGDVTLKIVENSAEFKDIERVESWAGDAIEFTSARELFSGTGNNNFQPDGKMSRGALVTLLYRLSYEPDAPALKFGDVDESSIYADAVAWADSNSIVSGYGNGTFMPDNVITREQLVTLIYQYAQFKGVVKPNTGNINTFTDADKVSSYAKEAMAWAIGAGIVSGQGDNTLNPTGSTTRAQTAVILMKLCDYMAK